MLSSLRWLCWFPLALLAASPGSAAEDGNANRLGKVVIAPDISPELVRQTFTPVRVVVTGTVEGVTEFLPVSSTGHMIISDAILGVPNDTTKVAGVTDRKGRRITLERVADDYIVIIQVGAIFAVLFIFWHRVSHVLRGVLRGDAASWHLAIALLIAFCPAALLGLFFKDVITEYLFSPVVVALALITGGIVILLTDKKLKAVASQGSDEVQSITYGQALVVGLCQCLALIPGTSRSLSTILGGRFAGLSQAAAVEFSFLVGLIILTAASVYKMWSLGPALTQVYPIGPALGGLVIAGITALIAVKWMVGLISRRGLVPFAWYRIAFGLGILLMCVIG